MSVAVTVQTDSRPPSSDSSQPTDHEVTVPQNRCRHAPLAHADTRIAGPSGSPFTYG